MLEPLDVPGAEEEVGGLAALDLIGLGVGGSGPEEDGREAKKERPKPHRGLYPI